MQGIASRENVDVKYVCDLEEARAAGAASALEKTQSVRPKTTKDMREVFDDKDVHGVVIATPEQWHALATIWACQAGKDVYVEKCISRRVEEGRKMVEAASKYQRIVQAGTQHRSGPYMAAASQYIREGKLGEVFYVKVCNMLPEVYGGYPQPKVPNGDPPKGFDWDQWLGPAPERPYNAQVHRNWHGWWDFSGGNSSDGIHQLDLARMLLQEPSHPKSVQCVGGRWRYADGGEMPDMQIVSFQWDKLAMTLREHRLHARDDQDARQDPPRRQDAQLAPKLHADRGLRHQGRDVPGPAFPRLAGAGARQQDRRGAVRGQSGDAPLPEFRRLHPQPQVAQRRRGTGARGRVPGALGEHLLSPGQSEVDLRPQDREVRRQRRGQPIPQSRRPETLSDPGRDLRTVGCVRTHRELLSIWHYDVVRAGRTA